MTKQRLTKKKIALGVKPKAKRLNLQADNDELGFFVTFIFVSTYHSQQGCKKHVYMKHGCYYFFEEKPEMAKKFPSHNTRDSTYKLP